MMTTLRHLNHTIPTFLMEGRYLRVLNPFLVLKPEDYTLHQENFHAEETLARIFNIGNHHFPIAILASTMKAAHSVGNTRRFWHQVQKNPDSVNASCFDVRLLITRLLSLILLLASRSFVYILARLIYPHSLR